MENILKKIYQSKKTVLILRVISLICVISSVVGFAALFAQALYISVVGSPWALLKLALTLGVPFVLVTVLRGAVNAPRPYELYDFYEEKPKEKSGRSFPSRHAYSSAVISVSVVMLEPLSGGVLVFLTLLLCACRVLLGIHFVRDVAAGAAVGALSAALGGWIFSPF